MLHSVSAKRASSNGSLNICNLAGHVIPPAARALRFPPFIVSHAQSIPTDSSTSPQMEVRIEESVSAFLDTTFDLNWLLISLIRPSGVACPATSLATNATVNKLIVALNV